MLASNPLIQVTPGLMIWTIVCFGITYFVLRRYAFGPIQQLIDARRDRIELAIQEADNARDEARNLLEEHRKLIGQAKSEAEEILSEAAQEQGKLDTVRTQLDELREAIASNDELRELLDNPEADSRLKADVLADVAGGADDLVVNFVRLLAEKGRSGELGDIADEL